ncbi:MAG: uridine kinase, partial [Oligoflexia bacterium]|nr:uridine kinase [Oligoflexia bacterium]
MLLIGIAGGSGSGKTTFAKKLIAQVNNKDLSLLHMDSYYLPSQPKTNYTEKGIPNFDHPDAFDWDLLRQHLGQLKRSLTIDAPVYNFKCSKRDAQTEKVGPGKVLLFEGIF